MKYNKYSIFENGKNRIYVSDEAMKDGDFAMDFSQKHNAEILGFGLGYYKENEFFIEKYHFPKKIIFVDSIEEMNKYYNKKNINAELVTLKTKDSKDLEYRCLVTENFTNKFKKKNVVCDGHTHFPSEMPRLSLNDILNIYSPNNHDNGFSITSIFQIGFGIVFFGFPSYRLDALHNTEELSESMIDDLFRHNYDEFFFKRIK